MHKALHKTQRCPRGLAQIYEDLRHAPEGHGLLHPRRPGYCSRPYFEPFAMPSTLVSVLGTRSRRFRARLKAEGHYTRADQGEA